MCIGDSEDNSERLIFQQKIMKIKAINKLIAKNRSPVNCFFQETKKSRIAAANAIHV